MTNYERANKLANKARWKVTECHSGPKCWCRMIELEDPIKYTHNDNEDTLELIVGAGTLSREAAQHIVKLHNESLEQPKSDKQKLLDAKNMIKSELASVRGIKLTKRENNQYTYLLEKVLKLLS